MTTPHMKMSIEDLQEEQQRNAAEAKAIYNVMPCANAGRFPSIISLANSATERLHLLPALSLGLTEGAFFTPLVICSAFLAIMLYRYTLEGN